MAAVNCPCNINDLSHFETLGVKIKMDYSEWVVVRPYSCLYVRYPQSGGGRKEMAVSIKTNIRNLATVIAGVLVLGAMASASEPCSKKGLGYVTKAILLAAANENQLQGTLRSDRRVLVSELKAINGISAEAVRAAQAVARASVEISESTKNGEMLNPLFGTGFLYGDRCHVLTVRHNVNKSTIIKNASGHNQIKLDGESNPEGALVKISHGLISGDRRIENSGRVLKTGTLAAGLDGDWALIRLAQPAPVEKVPVFVGEDKEMIGTDMMLVGLPADMSGKKGQRQMVVDPQCKGLAIGAAKLNNQGIVTNCLSASGNSGGAIAGRVSTDKEGREIWGIIGMLTNANPGQVAAGPSSSDQASPGVFLNLKKIDVEVAGHIENDNAKNPCK
ncbi:MAG: trypsin-like peptidase domain-containing protein [Bdellovibrionales bacterium]